jgi:hypothetical protein
VVGQVSGGEAALTTNLKRARRTTVYAIVVEAGMRACRCGGFVGTCPWDSRRVTERPFVSPLVGGGHPVKRASESPESLWGHWGAEGAPPCHGWRFHSAHEGEAGGVCGVEGPLLFAGPPFQPHAFPDKPGEQHEGVAFRRVQRVRSKGGLPGPGKCPWLLGL